MLGVWKGGGTKRERKEERQGGRINEWIWIKHTILGSIVKVKSMYIRGWMHRLCKRAVKFNQTFTVCVYVMPSKLHCYSLWDVENNDTNFMTLHDN